MINCTENLSDLLKAIHQAAVKLESESGHPEPTPLTYTPCCLLPVCSKRPYWEALLNMRGTPASRNIRRPELQPPDDAA